MKVKLTKIKSLLEGSHPNNIEEGYVKIGIVHKPPTEGESFLMTTNTTWFCTSVVTKILDNNTFETMNSVYKWEEIKEQLSLN
jgi:hypothetical protein